MGPDVDVLPCLLLPLAGPEEFDEEDTEKLPFELQYLGENKKRESDADIRKMLLEALLQVNIYIFFFKLNEIIHCFNI